MILVYNGPKARITIHTHRGARVAFDQGVPTHVSDANAKELLADPDVSKWPGRGGKIGRPILIHLGGHPTEVLHGITAMLRIRDQYPTCPQVVRCGAQWHGILPPFASGVASIKGGQTGVYYRTMKLARKDNLQYFGNHMHTTKHGCERLMTLSIHGARNAGEVIYRQWDWIKETQTGKPIVITEGREAAGTWPTLAKYVGQRMRNTIGGAVTPENIKAIAAASFVVACGNSYLIQVALHLGKPVLAALPANNYRHEAVEYNHYPNFNFILIGDDDQVPKIYDKIMELTGGKSDGESGRDGESGEGAVSERSPGRRQRGR